MAGMGMAMYSPRLHWPIKIRAATNRAAPAITGTSFRADSDRVVPSGQSRRETLAATKQTTT